MSMRTTLVASYSSVRQMIFLIHPLLRISTGQQNNSLVVYPQAFVHATGGLSLDQERSLSLSFGCGDVIDATDRVLAGGC